MMGYILCYGVRIAKTDLYDKAVAKGTHDIYAAVYSRGIQYQAIGSANYSDDFLIGYCKVTEEVPLVLEEDETGNPILPFKELEKDKVKEALLSLGITEDPQHIIGYVTN